eukprot:TRINITY_DN3994_c0_g1_i1.p1 TRINITY_DN3994_c0_g1~~TRINITY_DN3994_c0_g1_i1.p1  ORF type:complete len:1751 (+),score=627.91 TRINITY_DN3994_c0_g1_i1:49-5301(+)
MVVAAALLPALSLAASCSETLASASDLTRFSVLLGTSATLRTRIDSGAWTIFAPSNDAFLTLSSGHEGMLRHGSTTLTNLLAHHLVADDRLSYSALRRRPSVRSLGQGEIAINDSASALPVSLRLGPAPGQAIVVADIECDTGTVHVLGGLLPNAPGASLATKSLMQLVSERPDLRMVQGFAGLEELLQGSGPLSAVLPSDGAFNVLPIPDRVGLMADSNLLKIVLSRHVLQGFHFAADFDTTGSATAMDGHVAVQWRGGVIGKLHAGAVSGLARVETSDLLAANGVLHIVDGLLVPIGTDFRTVPTVVSSNSEMNEFANLMQESKASSAVRGIGPFSCLSPTDAAFGALSTGAFGHLHSSVAMRKAVFLHHVMYSALSLQQLTSSNVPHRTLGSRLHTHTFEERAGVAEINKGEARFVRASGVNSTDSFVASNGIVHPIDAVLLPPNVTLPVRSLLSITAGRSDLTRFHRLVAALQDQPDRDQDPVKVVSGAGPFTFFAFTDDAWEKGLTQDERDNLNENAQLIDKVARYHLTGGGRAAYHSYDSLANRASDAGDVGVSTLYREGTAVTRITFNSTTGTVMANSRARFRETDIVATDGVLHIIDQVLLPANVDELVHGGWGWERCDTSLTVQDGNTLRSCVHKWQCYAHHTNDAVEDAHGATNPNGLLFICFCLAVGALLRHVRQSTESLISRAPYELTIVVITVLVGAIASLGKPLSSFVGMENMDPTLMEYIFIPPLIFQAAFSCDVQTFRRVAPHCVILAVPGVIIMALLFGSLVKLIFQEYSWNFMSCFLFGTIVAATDPVATGSLLNDLVASPTVSTLMTGESLFNSGTAIALYWLVKDAIVTDTVGSFAFFLLDLLRILTGGPAIGLLIAYGLSTALKDVFNDVVTEVASILAVAYATFFVCEGVAHVSGVLGVVVLGLYMSFKESAVSPEVLSTLRTVLDIVVWFTNTVVFGLSGLIVRDSFTRVSGPDVGLVIIGYLCLNMVRGVLMLFLVQIFKRLKGVEFSNNSYLLFTWGGLRGSVALTLALVVRGNDKIFCFNKDYGEKLIFHTAGIVILTLTINGMLAPKLVERFALNDVSHEARRRMQRSYENLVTAMEEELMQLKTSFVLSEANWNRVKKVTYGGLDDPYGTAEAVSKPSQAEIVEAARNSYYALFDQSIWQQFQEGLLLGSAHRVLHGWASAAKQENDPACGGFMRWRRDVWSVPRWKAHLCCWKKQDKLELRRFGFGFNVLLGFIHAHDLIMQKIDTLVSDTLVVSAVKDHCKQVKVEASQMLEEATADHSDVSVAMRTKAAARHVLNAGRLSIAAMEADTRLSRQDATVLRQLVERQMKKIPKLPRSLRHPENDEMLREWVEWYRIDPQCMFQLSHIFRYQCIAKDTRLFKRGSGDETRFFFVILRGLVRVHHAGSAQLSGQGAAVGLLSSLTDTPGRFADAFSESVVHAACFPAPEVRHCTRIYSDMSDAIWLQAGRGAAFHCLSVHNPWREWPRQKLDRLVNSGLIVQLVRGKPTHLKPGSWYVLFNGRCCRVGQDDDCVNAVSVIPERLLGSIRFDARAMVLSIPDPSSSQAKARKRWQKIHQRLRVIRSSTWLQGFTGYALELRHSFPDPEPGELEQQGASSHRSAPPAQPLLVHREDSISTASDLLEASETLTRLRSPARQPLLAAAGLQPSNPGSAGRGISVSTASLPPGSAFDSSLARLPVERRKDTTDGRFYTREQFATQYGGTNEWDAAPRPMPVRHRTSGV